MNLTQKETIEYLKTEVKKYQSRQRFEHTLSVLSECEKLAGIFGLGDAERFDLCKAAVLHDLTKDMNGAKQASLCEKYGLPNRALHKTDIPFCAVKRVRADADDTSGYRRVFCEGNVRE